MITFRISPLAVLLTLLAASVAVGQIQAIPFAEPSARQSSSSRTSNAIAPPSANAPQSATSRTATSEKSDTPQSGGWLKRLVLGTSDESAANSTSIQFSGQPSSRQAASAAPPSTAIRALPPVTASTPGVTTGNSPARPTTAAASRSSTRAAGPVTSASSQGVARAASQTTANEDRNWFQRVVFGEGEDDNAQKHPVQLAGQASSRQTYPTAPVAAARPAENNDRGSWLGRLVLGEKKNDQATASPAPATKPATSGSVANHFAGVQTPSASSATPSRLGVASAAVGNRPAPREGSAYLANSLASANEAAQPGRNIKPDSDRSISLTNWISRLRKPESDKAEPSYAYNPFNRPNASDALQLNQALDEVSQQVNSPMASSRNTNLAPNAAHASPTMSSSIAPNQFPTTEVHSLEDSSRSLTNWISRPFRAMTSSEEDKELLATRLPTPTSKAPVRLPTVGQTVSRPSPSGSERLQVQMTPLTSPAPQPTQDTSSQFASAAPVMFGNGVRWSAAVPSITAPQVASLPPTAHSSAPSTSPMWSQSMLQAQSRPPLYQRLDAEPLPDEMYPSAPPATSADSPLNRPKIIFNPAAMAMNARGQAVLKPTVQVTHAMESNEELPPMTLVQTGELPGDTLPPPQEYVGPQEGELPLAEYPAPDYWVPEEMPYEQPMTWVDTCKPFLECGYTVLAHLNGPRSCPSGIGVENVMNAPFWIDTTQPLNNCRIRGDAAADWEFPDRIEYFWAKTPGGRGPAVPFGEPPIGEPSVDYQEVSFYIERGGDRFSVGTDLPIRVVDPVIRETTAGFADMRVTTKAVLLDGKEWQLTQVFHTHIPTGSVSRGTGNGHVSLEPGVAWRYKWSDVTYIHGDLTYWFPIAADPDHSGQMFNYGIAISHVWMDSDKWALIPTLELNAWTILDGRQTRPVEVLDPLDPIFYHEIDTLSILNIHPGLRWVCDTSGDCGVREFGISSGIALTEDHWYDEILRLELRWVF